MTGKLTFGIRQLRLYVSDRREVKALWAEVTAGITKGNENIKGLNLG